MRLRGKYFLSQCVHSCHLKCPTVSKPVLFKLESALRISAWMVNAFENSMITIFY